MLISLAFYLLPPVITDYIIGISIIGIVVIIKLTLFTINIYKLTNIRKDDKRIKIFNYLLIIVIPVLIISKYMFNTENYNNEIIAIIIVSLIIGVEYFSIIFLITNI